MIVRPIVRRWRDPEALAAGLAARLAPVIADIARRRGLCHLALAGGKTPRAMYTRLAHEAAIDWSRVAIQFGDERMVEPDDPSSNYLMACESLLAAIETAPAAVDRIHGELGPDAAAEHYDVLLRRDGLPDVALLGMGDDGHVASLFPGTVVNHGVYAMPTISPIAPFERVSMTFSALAHAEMIVLIVSGTAKAERLAEVWQQIVSGKPTLPAARVAAHSDGRVEWHVDEDAAAFLPESLR